MGKYLWYLLDRHRPNHSPPLIPLPEPPFASAMGYTPVALGHTLFLLGGHIDGIPSSIVQIYDARFNCWRLGPPMLASHVSPAIGVISGRIYVVGSIFVNQGWAEEFDPETERWRQISSTSVIRDKWRSGSAVIRGKLFAVYQDGVGVVFDPAVAVLEAKATHEKAWSLMPDSLCLGWEGKTAFVGDILFSFGNSKKIKGYDFTTNEWRIVEVEGLDEVLPQFFRGANLCNFGGVLCVIWEERRNNDKEFPWIICAGVRVMKTNTGSFHGLVEWFERCSFAVPFGSVSNCISLEF